MMPKIFSGALRQNNFERISLQPTWKRSLIIVVSGIAFLTWLKSCWRGTSVAADLIVFGGAFVTVFISLIILWSVMAALLFFSTPLFNPVKKVSYGNMFSLVSLCGIIFLIGEMLNFILVRSHLISISLYSLPGRFPIGLDVLFLGRNLNLPLTIVLYSVNPIIIWYFSAMSIGLKTMTGIRSRNAAVIVTCLWGVGVGSAAMIASLMGGTTFGIRIG
ncbi:MAG TPA: YIP1 family protein [Bacteroidota bacterium]|nr:YIP1 family protein [Bacteroidota bacterium]